MNTTKSTNHNHHNNLRKYLLYAMALFIILFVTIFVLEKTRLTNFIKLGPDVGDKVKTTSDAPSAQDNFTGGGDRIPVQSTKEEGSVSDNSGVVANIPDEDQWSTSQNGSLTVYRPGQNRVLKNGDTLSGKSSNDTISFRLADNLSGVIATGSLKVVDEKFSGTFNFSTRASEGRVDVYTTASDGTESNNIRIPVRFGE